MQQTASQHQSWLPTPPSLMEAYSRTALTSFPQSCYVVWQKLHGQTHNQPLRSIFTRGILCIPDGNFLEVNQNMSDFHCISIITASLQAPIKQHRPLQLLPLTVTALALAKDEQGGERRREGARGTRSSLRQKQQWEFLTLQNSPGSLMPAAFQTKSFRCRVVHTPLCTLQPVLAERPNPQTNKIPEVWPNFKIKEWGLQNRFYNLFLATCLTWTASGSFWNICHIHIFGE